jgi:hypothetical protein
MTAVALRREPARDRRAAARGYRAEGRSYDAPPNMDSRLKTFFSTLALTTITTTLTAQCLPPASVTQPATVPVSAQQWSLQHFPGTPVAAGSIYYILISMPSPAPIPFSALPGLFCNVVGNTPCLYADLSGASWFDVGPSPGQGVTLTVSWQSNPALVGVLFVAQMGTFGCAGPAPDLSVLVPVVLN